MAVNAKGEIKFDIEVEADENTRYLSYITDDDFEQLDDRFFHIEEIANLLGSSHHQQRMFTLNLLTKLVRSILLNSAEEERTKKKLDILFGTLLNSEVSQIP